MHDVLQALKFTAMIMNIMIMTTLVSKAMTTTETNSNGTTITIQQPL
ncbi:hypothetical protein DOY81_007883 [Sarcophaga bullata]|nr:hypothetical protein DOY81_007883 [Sarcophaga bullata]